MGYQFIALAPGKLFGKQRDFQPVCYSSSSRARRCKKCWFKELYLDKLEAARYGRDNMAQLALFAHESSLDKQT